MVVNRFEEKLNKVDGNVYVIEEKVFLNEGVYNGELKHDNINPATLAIYTGPRLTGDRVQTYTVSSPSLTPWKRVVKVFADVPEVFISYETDGDTVEAEDINLLQEAVTKTQTAVNSEYERAVRAEDLQRRELEAESQRAKGEEAELAERLAGESGRAEAAERILRNDLSGEIERAKTKEGAIEGNLASEVARAVTAERLLANGLSSETARAVSAEKTLEDHLGEEIARATTKEGELQTGLDAESSRAKNAEAAIQSTININKPVWEDKYTRNEVDNKFSTLETSIDWKESVATYADIERTYLAPEDGWTVNVKDTDYTYRYSGSKWAAISANSIPKATQSVDGLLSKEDKRNYDDANSKKHMHGNSSILDKLTETLLTNWNVAFTHISDAVKHVTSNERLSWNDANDRKHDHGNKAVLDKVTQILLDNWNGAFSHSGNKSNPHAVTKTQVGLGNVDNTADMDKPVSGAVQTALDSKVDKISGKSLSTNDYTANDKSKLSGIAAGAEVNVQSDWFVTDTALDTFIKNKPASMPASDVPAWAKAAVKPVYGWIEITGKPSAFTPSSHTHMKSQITDMPTKLSQFDNDKNYLTSADIDLSQSHAHDNKMVLDKITQVLIDKWNSALTALPGHTHVKSQITDFPSSMPANGGNAATVGGFTVGINVPANAKFTDTVYTHANSGVSAGTYQSVTVNAQGHVIGGTRPTTLAGYGITDAMPMGPFSWAQMHGAYTWNQLKGV